LVFITIMALLTGLMIYTFKTVFTSFIVGSELGNESELSQTKVDEKGINEAYSFIFDKESVKLEIK